MCAILGGFLRGATPKQLKVIKEVFRQSQIRGKHATGVTYLKGGKLNTLSSPVPASRFIEENDPNLWLDGGDLKFIGHCRYSTSDLKYNQPISHNPSLSIVHNGVVTQDPPEMWSRYGYTVETSNDSELFWRCLNEGKEPLVEFPDSSCAVAELRGDGKMRWYRNGKRPLHYCPLENGFILTSTKDIAVRSGLSPSPLLDPGTVYTESDHTIIKSMEDLIYA
jgi:glutamine phosphoribosylpyrophosphate amidotransferase